MCMITIGNKVYRNLEEQVKKNKDDIEKLQASSITITGESIANVTNDTSTIVKHLADNSNIEYMLSTPTANKINNSLQLPDTEISYTQLVGIGTNKSQANIEIDTATLKIENNKLSAITSGVTKEYVDSQDAKLQQSINATDSQVQTLNEEVATIKTDTIPALNNQLAATNTEVAKKLDKMTSTGSGVKAYVHENGVDRLLNATSDKTRNLIVRWDSNAQLHANAGTTDDAVVNKKQMEDAIANKLDKATTTSGSYAYCRNGNNDETIPVNSLVGTDAIVRRTSTGTIKANAGVDENDCVNKKQLNATDATVQALNEEVETIKTDTIPAINATIAGLGKVVKITQAAYDALATKDANTLYVIVG